MRGRNWWTLAALLLMVAVGHDAAWAQAQSNQPIKIIVPYPAGGGGDIVVRNISPGMEQALGRSIIVENITGATGSIGLMRTIQSPPDGNTMVYVTAINTANAATRPNSSVNLNRDLDAVGRISQSAFVLAVSPQLGINSVQDLIALGKKNPGLRFGSTGPGSNHHLLGEMFKNATGLQMIHVPYRGEAAAIPDLIAGRIDLMFLTASIAPYLDSKQLIGLGVSSAEPWFSLPQLKPLSESGLPNFVYTGWNGLMAPKGTPRDVIVRLNEALAAAIKSDIAVKMFNISGFKPTGGPPEALVAEIDNDMKLYERIIREQNLTFEK